MRANFNQFYFFSFLVREKFKLDVDAEIRLQDEEGAEIDEEVFPALLEQTVIPMIIFKIEGELESPSVSPKVDYGKKTLFPLTTSFSAL